MVWLRLSSSLSVQFRSSDLVDRFLRPCVNCAQDHLGPSGPLGQTSSFSFVVMPWRQVQACLRQSCFQLDNEHAKVPDGLRDAWFLWSVRVFFFLFNLVLACGRSLVFLLWPSNSRMCLCRKIGRTRHRACEKGWRKSHHARCHWFPLKDDCAILLFV